MDELCKNQLHTVTISGYSSEGLGVARIDGRVVFVHGGVRGEVCVVRILKVLKNTAFARVEEILERSPARREIDCPHYPACGGCAFRHISYEEELEAKRRAELVMEVQSQVMDQFNDSRMGDTVEVLCDGYDVQAMSYVGRSYAESPGIDGNIYFTSDQPVEAGDFVRVRITGAMDGELTGERTEE